MAAGSVDKGGNLNQFGGSNHPEIRRLTLAQLMIRSPSRLYLGRSFGRSGHRFEFPASHWPDHLLDLRQGALVSLEKIRSHGEAASLLLAAGAWADRSNAIGEVCYRRRSLL